MTKRVDPSQLSPLFRLLTQAALASTFATACDDGQDIETRSDAGHSQAEQTPPAVQPQPPAMAPARSDGGLSGSTPDNLAGDPEDAAIMPTLPGEWIAMKCEYNWSSEKLDAIRPTRPISGLVALTRSIEAPSARFEMKVGLGQLCPPSDSVCNQASLDLAHESNCPSCTGFVVSQQNGVFTPHTTRESLRELLGPIDTHVEAIFVAAMQGLQVACARMFTPQINLRGTEVRVTKDGFDVRTEYSNCDGSFLAETTVSSDATVGAINTTKIGNPTCIAGRRPDGLRAEKSPPSRSALGSYFAQAARLEAASVHAFVQLARELTALNAPQSLIDACHEAVHDELRHARDVAQLTRELGGVYSAPHVEAGPLRSAFEIARENAVEGCVRETFGALLATYQAASARDSRVRQVMQQIAEDETMHARLSWQLAAWLEPQLSDEQRNSLAEARSEALNELRGQLDLGLSDDECAAIGMPVPQVASSLLQGLQQTLLC